MCVLLAPRGCHQLFAAKAEIHEGIPAPFTVDQEKGELHMNNRTLFLRAYSTVGLASLLTVCTLAADSERIAVSGFVSPETVIHDPLTDLYLVSNVGGPPVTVNHGFISRVSPDGT